MRLEQVEQEVHKKKKKQVEQEVGKEWPKPIVLQY